MTGTDRRMTHQTSARTTSGYTVRMARDTRDLRSAQRLRYGVFVEELGARTLNADHAQRLEADAFDPLVEHLLLIDTARDADPATETHVVGVYRLLDDRRATEAGRFYSEGEYDLGRLRASGRRLIELGRSCVHPDHRRGPAMLLMWNAFAAHVIERGHEILFGVASFPGASADLHAEALAWLHAHHRTPEALRVPVLAGPNAVAMDRVPAAALDGARALSAIPPLIRAYLRLGGTVGEGAYLDHDFNTTDVFLMVDTSAMSGRAVDFYTRKAPRA